MARIIRRVISSDEVREDYFQWLCGLVGISTPGHSYWSLGRELHKKVFYWTVPNDDNRAEDGKKLREEFFEETSSKYHSPDNYMDCLDEPCSVFEMLIGLSDRIQDILFDPSNEDGTTEYFWVLIRNLGLEVFTDEDFSDRMGPYGVNLILEKLLERDYDWKGNGGLFPLRHAQKDQRKVEIWYQMSSYINENYTF